MHRPARRSRCWRVSCSAPPPSSRHAASPLLRLRRLAPVVAAAVLLGGCGGGSDKPVVVATTTQLGDFARVVGGEDVAVHQILKPNTDPHEYEPRPDDVKATANAKVVFANGDGLDGWVDKVVEQ